MSTLLLNERNSAFNISKSGRAEISGQINRRFEGVTPENAPASSSDERIVFIYITSSPHHLDLRQAARKTWLLPCLASPHCDYRFFVDAVPPRSAPEHTLNVESAMYRDIVFRDSCPMLMQRHPLIINYGNSPPTRENTAALVKDPITGNVESVPLADYPHRRLYKVEWKVCFLKWAVQQQQYQRHQLAEYHVMVEDDSFVCTENLLHQLTLLYNRFHSSNQSHSFSTGTPMFDGFDDSSTIMTKDLVQLFAAHYGEAGFNCSNLVDHFDDAGVLDSFGWLSWGNSWMSRFCDWFGSLAKQFDTHPQKPLMDCGRAVLSQPVGQQPVIRFPCTDRPLILHHQHAGSVLMHETSRTVVHHVCEYMLLIDKVKLPYQMYELWHVASLAMDYLHDLSEVFLHNDGLGWRIALQKLAADEAECREQYSADDNRASVDAANVSFVEDGMLQCIFQKRRRRLNTQESVRRQLYTTRGGDLRTEKSDSWTNTELLKWFFGRNHNSSNEGS